MKKILETKIFRILLQNGCERDLSRYRIRIHLQNNRFILTDFKVKIHRLFCSRLIWSREKSPSYFRSSHFRSVSRSPLQMVIFVCIVASWIYVIRGDSTYSASQIWCHPFWPEILWNSTPPLSVWAFRWRFHVLRGTVHFQRISGHNGCHHIWYAL